MASLRRCRSACRHTESGAASRQSLCRPATGAARPAVAARLVPPGPGQLERAGSCAVLSAAGAAGAVSAGPVRLPPLRCPDGCDLIGKWRDLRLASSG